MKSKKKHILLKGEGTHQHTLYGDFNITVGANDLSNIVVTKDSKLVHETPSGKFAEHNTLIIDQGNWVMGRQVEYNPFDRTISRVWD